MFPRPDSSGLIHRIDPPLSRPNECGHYERRWATVFVWRGRCGWLFGRIWRLWIWLRRSTFGLRRRLAWLVVGGFLELRDLVGN